MTRFGQNIKKLPYDAKIQYLECDGKSYIDLIFKQDFKYKLETEVFIPFVKNITYNMFGAQKSSLEGGTYYCAANAGTGPSIVAITGNYETRIANNAFADGQTLDILSNSFSSVFKVRNISTVLRPVHATDRNFILFGSSPSYMCAAGLRIYTFKYESDVTYVDLIPVRIGDIGYMYDKVSGKLFGNSGTGNFILGPDVKGAL